MSPDTIDVAPSTASSATTSTATSSSTISITSAYAHAPFSKLGVRLSFLDEFVARAATNISLEGKTTTEVCELVIKPDTQITKTSYCDLLASQGHPSVGTAEVFISHAWKYEFLYVVSALKHHFAQRPDVVIWFDLFSNNQHIAVSVNFDWWCGVFMSAISDFRRVVMVLSPWGDPISLKRAWCLFEVYCSAKMKCKFEVAFGAEQKRLFLEAMMGDAQSHVERMIAKIDCENSECFVAQDRDLIFGVVRREVGFSTINSMVFEQLRDWVVAVTKEEFDLYKATLESNTNICSSGKSSCNCDSKEDVDVYMRYINLGSALGRLYRMQTKFDLAANICKHVFDVSKAKFGEDDVGTLSLERIVGQILYNQMKLDESEPYLLHSSETLRLKLGEGHPKTLTATKSLAQLYLYQGRFGKAEPLFIKIFASDISNHGEDHPSTLNTVYNLVCLYKSQGRYDDAFPMCSKYMAISRDSLGKDHARTMDLGTVLTDLHVELGMYDEAEFLAKRILETRTSKLGDDNHSTISSHIQLAQIYFHQKKFDEAEPILLSCFDKYRSQLGDENLDTMSLVPLLSRLHIARGKFDDADSLCLKYLQILETQGHGKNSSSSLDILQTLAESYMKQHRYDEAEPLIKTCQEKRSEELGDNHPKVLSSTYCLAELYRAKGLYNLAEPLFKTCLVKMRVRLGEDHPSTLETINSLAELYKAKGFNDLAEASLMTCQEKRQMQRIEKEVNEAEGDLFRALEPKKSRTV